MKNICLLFSIVSLILLSNGCGDGSSEKRSTGLLPKASGSAGEMLVVMDSTQWKGALGDQIRNIFMEEVEGLPREEYMFSLNRVDPKRFNSVLNTVKNLLFVMTLDSKTADSKVVRNYFTKSSIQRIKDNAELFVYTDSDVYARGQEVMYLFGQDDTTLIKNLRANKDRLQNYFNQAENERLKYGLYKAKEVKGISKMLVNEHDCYMRIPFGYKLVVEEPGFIWVRQINDESDKNVFIAYTNYRTESVFKKENLIRLRDSIAHKQLFEDPADPATFLVTETEVPYIPVTIRQIDFNGNYAVEMQGLWRTNVHSMGGPFISYALVDEELGRLYYIEGFLYSPGKRQREFMRELEVILSTFRTKGNLPELASK
ncbi:MAG: DUF4837 family protein [Fulvivirga sp.]|nr:DUF4837 family protein [Fulvivirga sp.]